LTLTTDSDPTLSQVQQVYPVEEAEPQGLVPGTQLRPYQKQSLAFMLAAEVPEPEEAEQPEPRSSSASASSSKMPIKIKQQPQPSASPAAAAAMRGGWLADEVGMGKTLVVTSLVLAHKSRAKRIKDGPFKSFLRLSGWGSSSKEAQEAAASAAELQASQGLAPPPLAFRCTVVVVNNTLVQQWADEIKKFAPGLIVRMFFGSTELKRQAMQGLRDCDVLLTTPHMIGNAHHGWGSTLLGAMTVHRVVVDEAHLLATSSMGSKLLSLQQMRTQNMWLVSGTPFSTSLSQLNKQATLLGLSQEYHTYVDHPRRSNEEVVAWLRKYMIRHTKAMRIGGEVALALPEADCQTELLDTRTLTLTSTLTPNPDPNPNP
jgi:DNA repair protein RAD5